MSAKQFKDQITMYHISIGAIEADEDGNIWRLKRHNYDYFNDVKPRIIGYRMNTGYKAVDLYNNSNRYRVAEHRIVWIYFNGIIPEGLEINHKNGIKTDNRPSNLEAITHRENSQHSYDVLGRKTPTGENNSRAILTEKDVLEIRLAHKKDNILNQYKLGQRYGVHHCTINNIIHNRIWKHI